MVKKETFFSPKFNRLLFIPPGGLAVADILRLADKLGPARLIQVYKPTLDLKARKANHHGNFVRNEVLKWLIINYDSLRFAQEDKQASGS
jgi:hypothetical protein